MYVCGAVSSTIMSLMKRTLPKRKLLSLNLIFLQVVHKQVQENAQRIVKSHYKELASSWINLQVIIIFND